MRILRHVFPAGAVVAGTLLLTTAVPAQAATQLPPALAADYGAGWIGRQIDANGGYIGALSGADYNATALGVLALVAAEVGEPQAKKATDYLAAHVDAYVVQSGADRPAALATLILVAHARGIDPTDFGGEDLVARLLATKQTTGDDAGLFGSQDATYEGAYRQALSLLALDAAGETDADAIAWLVAEQCADGGWMGNRPDQSAPCPAFDFNTFVGEDTNGTALAAMALEAHGVTPNFDPLDFLASAQNEDGGFGFVPGFDSDTNSTALAIQALIAAGAPAAELAEPYAALLSFQITKPGVPGSGAFVFQPPTTGAANAFATVQAVPALAGKAFPIAPATLSTTLPAIPAAPVTTPPTAKPSATPKPIPSPIMVGDPGPPSASPTRAVNAGPVRELAATGSGEKPWDATGKAVFGLGLIGYGVLAMAGAHWARKRAA